jgi:hypothetical protein
MWMLLVRSPPPDAPYWPGRRWLSAIDAVAWPGDGSPERVRGKAPIYGVAGEPPLPTHDVALGPRARMDAGGRRVLGPRASELKRTVAH